MDRRTLLKSAAAISATAALPAAAVEAAPAVAPAVVVQPLNVKPYANYVWEWFVSHDGETYYEGFPTREEAFQYAQQCDYSLIAECKMQDFNIQVDGDRVLEWMNEDNYEQIGEGDGIECTREQKHDLSIMLTRAMEAWVVKHGINITAWSFGDVKNQDDVPERKA